MVDDQMSLEESVIRFVATERSLQLERVTPESTLYGDLYMYGEDADEFFENFAEKFDVDLSALNLNDHFPWEPSLHPMTLVWTLRKLFGRGTTEEKTGFKPITVSMLITAARKGSWPAD